MLRAKVSLCAKLTFCAKVTTPCYSYPFIFPRTFAACLLLFKYNIGYCWSVYAQTLDTLEEEKKDFYAKLTSIESISKWEVGVGSTWVIFAEHMNTYDLDVF